MLVCRDKVMDCWEVCDEVKLANSDSYYTKTEIDGYISDLEATDSVLSGSVEDLSEAVQTLEDELEDDYYSKEEIDAALSGKMNADKEVYISKALNGLNNKKAEKENTYTKTEVDNAIGIATDDMATRTWVENELEGDYASKEWVSGFTYDKATIEDMIEEGGGFVPENYYDKDATDALLDEKLDITAYTPTDLSNYYTKSETSGKTEIQTALNAKADAATTYTKTEVDNAITSATNDMATKTWVGNQNYALRSEIPDISGKQDISGMTAYTENSTFVAHTSNTTVHITANERTAWNNKSDFSGSYNDLTDKPTIPIVPTNVSAFNNDSGYITSNEISGKADSNTVYTKTEVDTALNQKQNTLTAGSGISISNNTISAKIWSGTRSQYEALTTKDSDTIYLIYNE